MDLLQSSIEQNIFSLNIFFSKEKFIILGLLSSIVVRLSVCAGKRCMKAPHEAALLTLSINLYLHMNYADSFMHACPPSVYFCVSEKSLNRQNFFPV